MKEQFQASQRLPVEQEWVYEMENIVDRLLFSIILPIKSKPMYL